MAAKGLIYSFLFGIMMLTQVIMFPGMTGSQGRIGEYETSEGFTNIDDTVQFSEAESLKGTSYPPQPTGGITSYDVIYYEDKYAILINWGAESRYWTDMTVVYETLVDVHGFDPANVFLLNYKGKDPDGNPDPRIDGNGTIPDVLSTFQYVESVADENDLVMIWVTDHGRGYSGSESPYYGYLDGNVSVDPGDEEDYLESEWKLRSLYTGGNYRRNHGLNEWAMRYKYYSSDRIHVYRRMYMSNFVNMYTNETGVISDNDVYIEEFMDYLEGDFNRDGYINASAGEVFDFDGDSNPPYDDTTKTYDEDDWGSIDNYTDNYNRVITKVPGNNYTIFDAGLDNRLDIDINYNPSALEVDGTDLDNAGLFDGIDVNDDGDMNDWVSIDEMLVMPNKDMSDDMFADGVRDIKALRTTYVFLPCFSGGFIDDLSGVNRAIATATVEELTSAGNAFIRQMAYAFKYEKSTGLADLNGDGNVSFREAFNYTSNLISWDVPQYDDNGDAVGHPTPLNLSQDGLLGNNIFINFTLRPRIDNLTLSPSSPFSGGNVNVTINFTNYMNTSIPLSVTFGIDPSFDAYSVTGNWVTNSRWEGSFTVTAPMSEGTYHFNVSGGEDFTGIAMRSEIDYFFDIDRTPPTGTIVINNDDAYVNSTSVILTLTASDLSGIADMRFSDNGTWWSTWETFNVSTTYTLTSGDGTKTVYVQFRDNAGLVSTGTISDDVILDTTPPTGTIVINSDDVYVNSTSVILTLTANDINGVADMRFSDGGASWSSWEPFSSSKDYILPSGDGTKTVYAQFRDNSGLTSTGTISDDVILDTAPPAGTIVINNDDIYATSSSVTLTLAANDLNGITGMRFSIDGTSWSAWESFGISKTYALPAGDGTKTVHVQYRDGAGLLSSGVISDDIILDTTAPTGTITIDGGKAKTNSTSVVLTLTSFDISGVVDMRFSIDGTSWSAWEPFSTSKDYFIPSGEGLKTVYVQYRDAAGLVSTAAIMDDITYEESKGSDPPEDPPDDNNMTSSTDQDSFIWILILAAIIIVAVLTAILLLRKKEKTVK
jgi:hypothetical protein